MRSEVLPDSGRTLRPCRPSRDGRIRFRPGHPQSRSGRRCPGRWSTTLGTGPAPDRWIRAAGGTSRCSRAESPCPAGVPRWPERSSTAYSCEARPQRVRAAAGPRRVVQRFELAPGIADSAVGGQRTLEHDDCVGIPAQQIQVQSAVGERFGHALVIAGGLAELRGFDVAKFVAKYSSAPSLRRATRVVARTVYPCGSGSLWTPTGTGIGPGFTVIGTVPGAVRHPEHGHVGDCTSYLDINLS